MYGNHNLIDCVINSTKVPMLFLSQTYFDVLKVSKLFYILLLIINYLLGNCWVTYLLELVYYYYENRIINYLYL